MSEDKDFKLKWEEFKLDASKHKPFEIKDFSSEDIKEQMKGASDFQKEMNDLIKANIRKARELNNKPFTNDAIKEIYIEPPILSRNVFNTAYKLGNKKERKKKNETL